MRRLLLIAYLFPPLGGGGVQRAFQFARHLPRHGWEVSVLTSVPPRSSPLLDPSLLGKLPPGTRIWRAPHGNPLAWLRGGAGQSAGRDGGRDPGGGPAGGGAAGGGRAAVVAAGSRWLRALRDRLLIPDEEVLWVPWAIARGLMAVARERPDAILSTSGPVSDHLVGLALRRRTGLPWVADFRDPWTQNIHRSGIPWREGLERRLEARVAAECDCLLTVTPSFAEGFRRLHGERIDRLEVIYNGFDPSDFEGLDPAPRDGRFTLVYAGILYPGRSPELLFGAVRRAIDAGEIPGDRIRLRFLGIFDYPGRDENARRVERFGLGGQVEVLGHLPHREALRHLKGGDLLLLIGDTAPGAGAYIPGKLFEYMAVGRPILALCEPGEAARIVAEHRLGRVVDPRDPEAIRRGLVAAYREWRERVEAAPREGKPSEGESRKADGEGADGAHGTGGIPVPRIFTRPYQAEQLARLLDELAASPLRTVPHG